MGSARTTIPAGRSCTGHEAGTSAAEVVVCGTCANHIAVMCGRVIQSGAPIRYAIVDGMNVRDSRVNKTAMETPRQDLLVIRRNQTTGKVSLDRLHWGLIPYWCEDPKGGRKRPSFLISRVIPVSVMRLEKSLTHLIG